MMLSLPTRRGLDQDGMIVREGSLRLVPETYVPAVEAARTQVATTFGGLRLHSAYLYGSVPRGTAIPGSSDLDLVLVLRRELTDADRIDATGIEAAVDSAFAHLNGVGIGLLSVDTVLSELERHDLGFFIACLCTLLIGEDLAVYLPRYRPDSLLARETNGDLHIVLASLQKRAAGAATGTEREKLSRGAARRIVRTGFTLIMPRWHGWTSDLATSAQVFGDYYPARAAQMRTAAAVARTPTADPAVLSMLLDDLGPWLAAEYTAAHGEKAPRS
jgi:uncharacterized protein